jgi:dsRNA-specific ribonuclease
LYRNEIVEELRQKHPKMNNGDLTEMMSNKWDALPKDKKKVYEDTYQKNLEKYKKDVEEYEKKYGKMEPVTQSVALAKPKKSKKKPK